MQIRRCLFCFAVVGACVHTAVAPIAFRHDDDQPPSPKPVTFVINAPVVASSTSSAVTRGPTLFLSTG